MGSLIREFRRDVNKRQRFTFVSEPETNRKSIISSTKISRMIVFHAESLIVRHSIALSEIVGSSFDPFETTETGSRGFGIPPSRARAKERLRGAQARLLYGIVDKPMSVRTTISERDIARRGLRATQEIPATTMRNIG